MLLFWAILGSAQESLLAGLGEHVGCRGPNLGQSHARQTPGPVLSLWCPELVFRNRSSFHVAVQTLKQDASSREIKPTLCPPPTAPLNLEGSNKFLLKAGLRCWSPKFGSKGGLPGLRCGVWPLLPHRLQSSGLQAYPQVGTGTWAGTGREQGPEMVGLAR